MAEEVVEQNQQVEEDTKKVLSSYLGLGFSIFLASLPNNSLSLVPNYETHVKDLSSRLFTAEEQLKQMKSRRKEDSKANARVVEIFASHRNTWQAEEKRLLQQIDAATEEIANLKAKLDEVEREKREFRKRVEDLEREVGEREEMIGFMSRRNGGEDFDDDGDEEEEEEEEEEVVVLESDGCYESSRSEEFENFVYGQQQQQQGSNNFGFGSDFLASSTSKFWAERASLWQV